MKLQVEQPTLYAALAKIASVVEQKTTIPILSHVALYATDVLTVCGTDLDLEVTTNAEAEIEAQGSATVNAALFAGIVKKIPKGAIISMELDDDILVVKSGRSRFKLATLPTEDYPSFRDNGYTATLDLQSNDIANLFGKSAFAISTEESRYYLNGVYLHNVDGTSVAVATDGHRLARVNGPDTDEFPGVIVPRKTVKVVQSACGVGPVSVSVSDSKIKFDFGDTVIASKVIEGTFPDYTRIIPENMPYSVTFDCDEMSAAVDRVVSVSEDKSRGVKFSIEEEGIVLSSKGSINEAEDFVSAAIDGEPVEIGFSSKYIVDTMRQIEGSAVIEYGESGSPALFKSPDDDKALFVIMPMRM